MLKILSSKNLAELEQRANKLDIEQVGSLSISNGHYFLVITIKDTPKVKPQVETKVPEVKPKAKRTPTKKSPSKPK